MPALNATATSTTPRREVHCEDALAWLRARGVLAGCSLVTSLPDVSELGGMAVPAWVDWFRAAADAVLRATPADGVAIFYQTDIKVDGTWVDKGALVQRAAAGAEMPLLFHRVVCRKPPGTLSFGRPTWAHLIAFSSGVRPRPDRAWADVIPDGGEATWTRGMGITACLEACRFVRDHTGTRTVVDPFCGQGGVLAAANALGLDAVGVELSRKRARRARSLRVVDGNFRAGAGDRDGPEDAGRPDPADPVLPAGVTGND